MSSPNSTDSADWQRGLQATSEIGLLPCEKAYQIQIGLEELRGTIWVLTNNTDTVSDAIGQVAQAWFEELHGSYRTIAEAIFGGEITFEPKDGKLRVIGPD